MTLYNSLKTNKKPPGSNRGKNEVRYFMDKTTNNIFPIFSKRKNSKAVLKKIVGGEPLMDIERVTEFQSELQTYVTQVDRALNHARGVIVDSDADAEFGIEVAGDLRKLSKKIDATKKEITAPARDFVSKINALASSFTDKLDQAIDLLASKVGVYKTQQIEAQRLELEEMSILEEATGSPTNVLIEPVRTNVKGGIASTYQTRDFDIEVVDMSKVPQDFLILDDVRVKAACKAGMMEIPGLKITERMVTRVRTR